MSIGVFLPVRKGSVRIKNKNLRKFSDIQNGLLELKLRQLIKLKGVEEIVVSTNDEGARPIIKEFMKLDSRIILNIRPNNLSMPSTDLSNLIEFVPEIVSTDYILWTHATSPFCDELEYKMAINEYSMILNKNFDSLVSVKKFQNYLYDSNTSDLINRIGSLRWPQTQDLKLLFEINNAIFLASREIYINKKDRIGSSPYLYEMNKLASMDIDEEDDFKIAEAVYEHFYK